MSSNCTRPPMTTSTRPSAHRTNPSCETINWAYPTQYRPCGPNQSIPSAAHAHSGSISSTITSGSSRHCHQHSRSDASTTVEGTSENTINSKYPERIDSRRALLSMANGIKAPFLLRGPSHNGKRAHPRGIGGGRSQIPTDIPVPLIPKRTSTVQYLHKELPPTPPSSNSSNSSSSSKTSPLTVARLSPERKAVLPLTKPLNLSIHANTNINNNNNNSTLAAKRLSRSRPKLTGGGLALSRFRAVPAPIQPPPPFRGTTAFNGPSSASTTDDEFAGDADIEELHLGEPLIAGAPLLPQVQVVKDKQTVTVMTPMGELPITPLDIPVDWDDLHDRWTSPVAVHHEEENNLSAVSASGEAFVFDAFRQDINELFARSPTIEVRGSIEAGFSPERESAYHHPIVKKSRTIDIHPFSCAADLDLSEADSEGSMKKEKRHGKVLVKKELKLCLDMNVDFGEKKNLRRRSSSSLPAPKAGESFLMISPLSPDSAVAASILC